MFYCKGFVSTKMFTRWYGILSHHNLSLRAHKLSQNYDR